MTLQPEPPLPRPASKLKRLLINDDFDGQRAGRAAPVKVTKGTTYYFQVSLAGFSSPLSAPDTFYVFVTGDFAAPSNDNFTAATPVTKDSFTVKGTTLGATTERTFEDTSNPEFTTALVRASVWWKWTPKASGTLTASTLGSTGDTALSISIAPSNTGYDRLVFSDDGDGDAGKISNFVFLAGTTYYFAVSNVSANTNPASGPVVLTVDADLVGPIISSVSPTSGKLAGGTKVTITGERLSNATTVMVGGVPATSVTVINSKKITAVTPAGVSKGAKSVYVYAGGYSTTTRNPKTFTYK